MSVELGDTAVRLPAATRMGTVTLTVSDAARSHAFYEQVLGLPVAVGEDGALRVGPDPAAPLLRLLPDPGALPRDPRHTGLFHVAVLLPDRAELAAALLRLVQARYPLDGASDHLVSEALYLSDPDGNGIEIYRDRPRAEWRRDEQGQLAMATLPLDLQDVAGSFAGGPVPAAVPAETTVGHVHLQVAELAETERFYAGLLGFDVMVRGYPGALFVAAGGYHHHLGLNTWSSRGGTPPPERSIGLNEFEVRLGSAEAVSAAAARLADAGVSITSAPAGAVVARDSSGNPVRLSPAA